MNFEGTANDSVSEVIYLHHILREKKEIGRQDNQNLHEFVRAVKLNITSLMLTTKLGLRAKNPA